MEHTMNRDLQHSYKECYEKYCTVFMIFFASKTKCVPYSVYAACCAKQTLQSSCKLFMCQQLKVVCVPGQTGRRMSYVIFLQDTEVDGKL